MGGFVIFITRIIPNSLLGCFTTKWNYGDKAVDKLFIKFLIVSLLNKIKIQPIKRLDFFVFFI